MTKEEEALYDNKEVNEKVKQTLREVKEVMSDSVEDILRKIDENLSVNFTRVEDEDGECSLTYKIDRRKNEETVKACVLDALKDIEVDTQKFNRDYIINMQVGKVFIVVTSKI